MSVAEKYAASEYAMKFLKEILLSSDMKDLKEDLECGKC